MLVHTHEFYEDHAFDYFRSTKDVDMTDLLTRFARLLPAGGSVLDVGCGSGRDLKWFRAQGFRAAGIDASERLCALAREYAGPEVVVHCGSIQDWCAERHESGNLSCEDPADPAMMYDGIWANASLLHLEEAALYEFFRTAAGRLLPGGVLYFSMKEDPEDAVMMPEEARPGCGTWIEPDVSYMDRKGRYVRLLRDEDLAKLMGQMHEEFEMVDVWRTSDRMSRGVSWKNVILKRIKSEEIAEPGIVRKVL